MEFEEFDSGGASSTGVKEKAGFSLEIQFFVKKSQKNTF